MKSIPVLSSLAAAALLLTALPAFAGAFDTPAYKETRVILHSPRLVPGSDFGDGWVYHQVSIRCLLLTQAGSSEQTRGQRRTTRWNHFAIRFTNRDVLLQMLEEPGRGLDGSISGWSLQWRVPNRGHGMDDGILVAVKRGRADQVVPGWVARVNIGAPLQLQATMVDDVTTLDVLRFVGRGRRRVSTFVRTGVDVDFSDGVGRYHNALAFRNVDPVWLDWKVLRRLDATCVYLLAR